MSTGRVVVITGASGGIGAELARQLAGKGYRLALAARRERELTEVARQCGEEALPVVADVTRREDVERLRDRALERFGQIDVWINNAGRGIVRRVLDLRDEDVDEMMTVNVKSALYGMQAIVPYFVTRGAGHLINISSFLGRVPLATFRSAYSAAKAALASLTTSLRMELAREHPGVHVSLVMPGVVTTDFARNALGAAPAPVTAPPPGAPQSQTPEEVAAAIARLIEHPAPEIYTNPALAGVARRHFEELGAFAAASPVAT